MTLGAFVSRRWGAEILGGPRLPDSHGERASRRYSVGGARREAADGFTTVYAVGCPRCVARSVTCRAIRKPRASMHASR